MNKIDVIEIASLILALMVAIIGHEIMHGKMAYHFGDDTAKSLGRLSINPLVHIDLFGTILVPALLYFSQAGFLFGWAKPVPINIKKVIQNGGYNAAIWVALAGIIYNICVAILAYIMIGFLPVVSDESTLFLHSFFSYLLIYNVILALFNLLPIPPLDGSHALSHALRKGELHKAADMLDALGQYGMILLIILIASPLSHYFFAPMQSLIHVLLSQT